MVWRASQLDGGRWFEPGFRYPFFQDGFTAYPVHIRVFGPASAPSSSQFIHFLDRPTGRDPQDLSAPLDGLCAYIPGSWGGTVLNCLYSEELANELLIVEYGSVENGKKALKEVYETAEYVGVRS